MKQTKRLFSQQSDDANNNFQKKQRTMSYNNDAYNNFQKKQITTYTNNDTVDSTVLFEFHDTAVKDKNTTRFELFKQNMRASKPKQKYLFTSGFEKVIKVWKIDKSMEYLDCVKKLDGSIIQVKHLLINDFARSRRQLITGGDSGIEFWDVESGVITGKIELDNSVDSMVLWKQGQYLIVSSNKNSIEIYSIELGDGFKLFKTLNKNIGRVKFMKVLEKGNQLLVVTFNDSVYLFDLDNDRVQLLILSHSNPIRQITNGITLLHDVIWNIQIPDHQHESFCCVADNLLYSGSLGLLVDKEGWDPICVLDGKMLSKPFNSKIEMELSFGYSTRIETICLLKKEDKALVGDNAGNVFIVDMKTGKRTLIQGKAHRMEICAMITSN